MTMMMIFVFMPIVPQHADAMSRDTDYSGWLITGTEKTDQNVWDEDHLEEDFNLAIGGEYTIPEGSDEEYYSSYTIEDESGRPTENIISISGDTIKGIGAGTAIVTFYNENKEKLGGCTIHVREIRIDTSKTIYAKKNIEYDEYDVKTTLAINQDITENGSQILGINRSDDGYFPVYGINFEKNTITVQIFQKGTTTFKINIEGKVFTIKIKLVPVELNYNNIVGYKGKTFKLKVKSPKSLKVSGFTSTNKKVATVSKTGKVKCKNKSGRCYIKMNVKGADISCLVEMTSKKAYMAVQNGIKDAGKKIVYSQKKRMTGNYRDCSSFVSRCYWDKKMKRKLFIIGGSGAKGWARDAAGQASWLNSHGRKVAKKKVSVKKLRPGDTIYYETDYAGRNKRWHHIDHAALYVGDGKVLTTGGDGGKGNVGWADYDYTWIKFIGRPCK